MYGFAVPAVVSLLLAAVSANDNIRKPNSTYLSESDIQAVALNVSLQNPDPENGFAPGYISIAPYGLIQRGPYIYDRLGNLTWSGYDAAYQMSHAMDHKACTTYDSSDHFCMWRGSQNQGYGLGGGTMMNSGYEIVRMVACAHGKYADIHEVNLTNGGKQHDAHFNLEDSTPTIVSLFANASNGFNRTATKSSGMIIAINTDTKAATLVFQTFASIPSGILSDSQGNSRVLDSGAAFHGWGSFPTVSETDPAGEAVLYATFSAYPVMKYRAYTAPWVATPNDKPALITQPHIQNTSTALCAYVNWNGATEVQSWRFWGSTSVSGPFHVLGNMTKKCFETRFAHANYGSLIFAEAVGGGGESSVIPVDLLGRNGTTIVPSSVPESSSVVSSSGIRSTELTTEVPGQTAATTVTTADSTATGPAPVATTSSTAVLAQDAGPVGKTLALCIAVGVMFAFL
ncbi:uncharacterized protein BDZ99DRAFT_125087 [Mytilinidion resinicola]|uniref:Uncharacterized protein n=1 Tax=Mytilinidion resinicola TaxID=574789 RepID=A0A6A6Z409_9PEZI|nr:uncharacterized protein BDZ99DRAFT_125087 [Mytilinidion resinicola]KAF2815881.1 hypothetical protein BDZ99DRAFT_125087 [Mytilinidion resinicola]